MKSVRSEAVRSEAVSSKAVDTSTKSTSTKSTSTKSTSSKAVDTDPSNTTTAPIYDRPDQTITDILQSGFITPTFGTLRCTVTQDDELYVSLRDVMRGATLIDTEDTLDRLHRDSILWLRIDGKTEPYLRLDAVSDVLTLTHNPKANEFRRYMFKTGIPQLRSALGQYRVAKLVATAKAAKAVIPVTSADISTDVSTSASITTDDSTTITHDIEKEKFTMDTTTNASQNAMQVSNQKTFHHEMFGDVRVVVKDGEPWFVASDICNALNIYRTQIRKLTEDEKGVHSVHTPGGNQNMVIVNEGGMYRLIFRSDKPEAMTFQKWVAHEVLPSIRKTGSYSVTQPASALPEAIANMISDPRQIYKLLGAYIDTQDKLKSAETKIEADRPKVEFADRVIADDRDITVQQLAGLCFSDETPTGRTRMYRWLRKHNYIQDIPNELLLDRTSPVPYQRHIEAGFFRVRYVYRNEYKFPVTMVTPKGVAKISAEFRMDPDYSAKKTAAQPAPRQVAAKQPEPVVTEPAPKTRKGGRKMAVDLNGQKFKSVYERYQNKQITGKKACNELGVSKYTFYKYLKKMRGAAI